MSKGLTIVIPRKLYKTKPAAAPWWGWRLVCRTYSFHWYPDLRRYVRYDGIADYPIHLRRLG